MNERKGFILYLYVFAFLFILVFFGFSFTDVVYADTIKVEETGQRYVYSGFYRVTDVPYDENYGYTYEYDIYTYAGHLTGSFFMKDEVLERKKICNGC